MKILAIGDIHGHLTALKSLLECSRGSSRFSRRLRGQGAGRPGRVGFLVRIRGTPRHDFPPRQPRPDAFGCIRGSLEVRHLGVPCRCRPVGQLRKRDDGGTARQDSRRPFEIPAESMHRSIRDRPLHFRPWRDQAGSVSLAGGYRSFALAHAFDGITSRNRTNGDLRALSPSIRTNRGFGSHDLHRYRNLQRRKVDVPRLDRL